MAEGARHPPSRWAALAVLALCGFAFAADALTWQEANKRSAELIKQKGYSAEATKLARQAFQLYGTQSSSYNPRLHAQLLLNLVDARYNQRNARAALAELEQAMPELSRRTSLGDPVMIDVWNEAARIAAVCDSAAAHGYFDKAATIAEATWGADDGRAIGIHVRWAASLRDARGDRWADDKLAAARARASKADSTTPIVQIIDLQKGKLEVEREHYPKAIELVQELIARIEAGKEPANTLILQHAYALLEFALEENGDKDAAAVARGKRLQLLGPDDELRPVFRVTPAYPRAALEKRIGGFVELIVTVDTDGTVKDAQVDLASRPGTFDAAAIAAVKQWKFGVRRVGGTPVEYHGRQRIEFRISQ